MKRIKPTFLAVVAIILALPGCDKEEPVFPGEPKEILMSTGWKLEHYTFHFNQEGKLEERDTLILSIIRSDSLEDTRVTYTDRWIVFDTESFAVTAFNYDKYTRPKGEPEWLAEQTDITGEAGTQWGAGMDNKLYLNPFGTMPIWIDLVDEHHFILRNAYLIQSIEPIAFGKDSITYSFGEFPPEDLKQIDAHYRSATSLEGPNWFPTWRYWPQ